MINSYQSDRAIALCAIFNQPIYEICAITFFSTADYLLASSFVYLFKSIVLIDYLHATNETIISGQFFQFEFFQPGTETYQAEQLLSTDHIANRFVPGLNIHNASSQRRLRWDLVRPNFSTMLTDTCGCNQQQK